MIIDYKYVLMQFVLVNIAIYKLSKSDNIFLTIFKLFIKSVIKLGNLVVVLQGLYDPFLSFVSLYLYFFEFRCHILSTDEVIKLKNDMFSVAGQLNKMRSTLDNLKVANNVKLISDKDGIALDVPSAMSDKDAEILKQKVAIADRVFNTQLEEFKKLLELDKSKNGGMFNKSYNKYINELENSYKSLFDAK